jgi:hypothetical protein
MPVLCQKHDARLRKRILPLLLTWGMVIRKPASERRRVIRCIRLCAFARENLLGLENRSPVKDCLNKN